MSRILPAEAGGEPILAPRLDLMHPELANLEQHYLHLVAELQAGHLSEADALAVLAGLQAIDGDGACWSIDPYSGEFTRAHPRRPPAPADPAAFVPARLPSPPSPTFGPGSVPTPGPGFGSPYVPPSLYPPGPPPASERIRARAGSLSSAAGVSAARAGSAARTLLSGRGRTVVTLAAAVVLVAVLVANRPAPAGPPGSPASTISTPAGSTAPQAGLPSAAELGALGAVLTSGAADEVAGVVDFTTDPALRDALSGLLGAPRAGLRIDAAPEAVLTEGRVEWSIRTSTADAAPVRSWVLILAASETGWRVVGVRP